MQQRYPAKHYVMVDDKANLLAAMKSALGARLTTVFVRQGHYALAAESKSAEPAPDLVIERIADLLKHDLTDF
jgi:phosphoglycolate phosphatase-like HAD superfamily hydrolase